MKKIPKLSDLSEASEDAIKSALVSTAGALMLTKESPDEALGELFNTVQQSGVYVDGMTFADIVPKKRMKQIKREYLLRKDDPDFDLHEFVSSHFNDAFPPSEEYKTNLKHSPREHIQELWKVLEKKNRRDVGSLIALPYPYIVPGGRFMAQFYWDSYFTMLGLAADGRWDLVDNMLKNCTYMIRKFGFIPTANRTYFLSRSQPPFLSHMVKLMARHRNRTLVMLEHLPYLLAEYRYWTKGKRTLDNMEEVSAMRRVVRLPDGSMLGRYFDDKKTPRPESMREDIDTASMKKGDAAEKLFLDLRAGAESGWDFSSRWFTDPSDIKTIRTTDIVPIDLNCLLYHLEATIAETYQLMFQPLLARKFRRLSEKRAAAILKYTWDDEEQFFVDYDFRTGERTGRITLAGVFPLYVKIATPAQAKAVAKRIEQDFLRTGGLVTTLYETGQQWDAPNGWAPLHWVAISGLREYGFHDLADKIKKRWVKTCVDVYKEEHKLVEKYNVSDGDKLGGGGEYALQDGFGWTNGVLSALLADNKKKS